MFPRPQPLSRALLSRSWRPIFTLLHRAKSRVSTSPLSCSYDRTCSSFSGGNSALDRNKDETRRVCYSSRWMQRIEYSFVFSIWGKINLLFCNSHRQPQTETLSIDPSQLSFPINYSSLAQKRKSNVKI